MCSNTHYYYYIGNFIFFDTMLNHDFLYISKEIIDNILLYLKEKYEENIHGLFFDPITQERKKIHTDTVKILRTK